jgi:plasmid maintenance system antidote protein VapI
MGGRVRRRPRRLAKARSHHLTSLLNGSANLSGDMTLRIEMAFGSKMDTLMRMQALYDIA